MRIIAGEYRGRRLVTPKGFETRPTTDRTRENLFNILSSRISFEGARVLDLFSGTGALGLESLSRGAEFCMFVEKAAPAINAIEQNIDAFGVSSVTTLKRCDVMQLGKCNEQESFDLVFADPPYSKSLGEKTASVLKSGNWISSEGLFVLEDHVDDYPESLIGLELLDVRKYGDTSIGIFKID